MEELFKRIKDGIAGQVLAEAEKYGRSFGYLGARIQLSERRTFDFSNDPTWCGLNNAIKQREDMLKHLTGSVADAETGELLNPIPFKTTSIITISLPK